MFSNDKNKQIMKRYPRLPIQLSDDRLLKKNDMTMRELRTIFRGRWYIVAGLNPAFDTFDCQMHDFYEPSTTTTMKGDTSVSGTPGTPGSSGITSNQRSTSTIVTNANESNDNIIADATFSYRVKKNNGGFFTKNGDKRLTIIDIIQDDPRGDIGTSTSSYTRTFNNEIAKGKQWGKDSFQQESSNNKLKNDKNIKTNDEQQQQQQGLQLTLTLRPEKMNYKDEWTILSYSTNLNNAYIVLAYRGTNAAWDGYGGVNIYTRQPIDISSLVNSKNLEGDDGDDDGNLAIMRDGIEFGLQKIGLTLQDLIPVDNQCH
jgi:hypothetical protein